jgi:hypothetical protein
MCVESISFVGKYVPIDTGTETRRRFIRKRCSTVLIQSVQDWLVL